MGAPEPSPRSSWQERTWLAVLAVVFTLRFPLHFFLLGNPFLMDFTVYHVASKQLVAGQGHSLYDVAYSGSMYFKYAPIWAALWLPLAPLSPFAGTVVWTAVNTAWLTATCWLVGRLTRLAGVPSPAWTAAAAVVLLSRPLIAVFSNGQVDLWWSGLVLFFLAAELTGRPWAAALALALSITLKLPSAIFLPYCCLAGRWGTAKRTSLCLLGLLALGGLVVEPLQPWHPLAAWVHRLADLGPQEAFQIKDQSLLALCSRFLSNDGYGLHLAALSRPFIVAIALGLNLVLFVLVIAPRRAATSAHRLIYDAALLMILMTLASPSAWLATYTTLIFPACLAIVGAVHALRERRAVPATIALSLLIGALSLATHSSFWKSIGLAYWKTESYVFLVFMIVPCMALTLYALLWRLRLPHISRS